MTDFTPARLAEMRAVAEAADAKHRAGVRATYTPLTPAETIALIDALEAKTADAEFWRNRWNREDGYRIDAERERDQARKERDEVRAEVEMWTKPQECVTEHEQPFDFKQCTTHDRTFPLDGDCDYKGLSIIDWQDQQVAEQRGRAVRAEMRAERAEAALERVKAIHHDAGESLGYTPEVRGGYGMIPHCCASCGSFGEYGMPWPCETIQAIEGADDE